MSASSIKAFLRPKTLRITPFLSNSCKPHPRAIRIKKLQEKFQVEDPCPIHLKGGFFDKVLYYTTMALSIGGLGYTGFSFYKFM